MSTNIAPSRRATNHPDSRPSRATVAEARFVEAKAITDALVVRLSRERSELAGTTDEARVRVLRRVEVTRLELTDARSYEVRVFEQWEVERKACAGKDVAGARCVRDHQHGFSSHSTISGRLATRLRPPVQGDPARGRRTV